MYAIISELDQDTAVHVMHLWRKLQNACGLEGIFNFPNPHFTWLTMESVEEKPACAALKEIAEQTYAFPVRITGVDVFQGDSPVLYLSIFMSLALSKIHEAIWQRLQTCSSEPGQYYSPDKWVPHITLAFRDLTNDNLACAVESIKAEANQQVLWVNNLMLVGSDDDQLGETIYRVELL